MIQRGERGIEPCVMIENRSRAVDVQRRAKFLGDKCKIDIFTVKLALTVTEKMHATLYPLRSTKRKVRKRAARALPKHSQAEIENRDQRHSHEETCQNKFFSMLQHFSEYGMRSQIEKSAAYVRHD
jgi:hypothetical protein